MSHFAKKITIFFNKMAAPVFKEPVFFLFFFFIISSTIWVSLFRGLIDGEGISLVLHIFKNLSLAVLISYIFTSIVYITRSKFVKILFYLLLILLFAINIYLRFAFGLTLSPLIVVLIGETTTSEASEFVRTFMTTPNALKSFLITFVLFVLILFEGRIGRLLKKYISMNMVKRSIILILTIMLIIGATQLKIYHALFMTQNTYELENWNNEYEPFQMDYVTDMLYALYGPGLVKKENEMAIETTYKASKLKHTHNNSTKEPLTIVYVLGESFTKHHSNIYGYELTTNPRLTSEIKSGNLFTFTNVVSPCNLTNFVAKNTFCSNSISEKEYRWFDYPYFPMIFKSSGFDVFMYDNQFNFDMNSNSTFSLIAFLFNKKIQELSYTAICSNRYEYDGDLVDDFFKNHQLDKKDNLVLFHLMGQHVKASERFPHIPQFIHFTKDSIKNDAPYITNEKKQKIADYDNATYYNDYVIWKIIENIRDKNALLVYFSDHGDEVFDYRDTEGRGASNDTRNMLKYQFELPFFIWCSDKYQSSHTEIMDCIRSAKDLPFDTENIAHVMFDLGEIKTPFYNPERDVLNPKYIIKPRIVYDAYSIELINYEEIKKVSK